MERAVAPRHERTVSQMAPRTPLQSALKATARAIGVMAGAYAGYVGMTWLWYGHHSPPAAEDADPLLDQFMPVYDVAERHRIPVAAPAETTLAAACDQDLMALPVVRTIFKARGLVLGSRPDTAVRPRGLLALTRSIGWSILADVPGREIVMGAVTQPWCADVVFRPLPPGEFAAFDTPDYVKIVWTLRADPTSSHESVFRTETRVVTTNPAARAKFRWYWARFSPGIRLIRRLSLGPLRRTAELRARRGVVTAGPAS